MKKCKTAIQSSKSKPNARAAENLRDSYARRTS
jgi:hypothetical protein